MKQVQSLSARDRIAVYEYLYMACTTEDCACPYLSGVGKSALLGLGITPVDYRPSCPLEKQCLEVVPDDWRNFVGIDLKQEEVIE